ncbi:cupin [bacterium 336/3]|nr:cupin [bacterium 336/3]
MSKINNNTDIEKSKAHIIIELIEYLPKTVVSRTIIKKTTGNIAIVSFDVGEEMEEKISPFDTYIQIIDGVASITIQDKNYTLTLGEGIIILAHAKHQFNAEEQFKMIATTIKSGYED